MASSAGNARPITRALTAELTRRLADARAFTGGDDVPPDPAASLPTANGDTATHLNSTATSNRYAVTTTIPAGDWTLGFWAKTIAPGICYHTGPNTSVYTSPNHLSIYAGIEVMAVTGLDGSSNRLGVSTNNPANSASRGLASRFNVLPNQAVFVCLRKVGSLIQLWLKWPGHAPVKVGEETTAFNGFSVAQAAWIGMDRGSSFRWNGQIRKVFLVSYALTDAQINEVALGADPASMGTPAATDYHFPTNPAGTTWTSTINGITATAFLTGYVGVTGLGYAALTEGVYLTPDQDGRVYQRAGNGRATVPLSGMYRGTDAPIQVLPLDWATNVSVGNWQTVAASPSGGVWSGSVSLPARSGWYKFQFRKVIGGTPSSEVMTSNCRVGVGEIVLLMGQSSMDNIGSGASGTNIVPNGLWSESQRVAPLINGVGQENVNVTATANVGGQIQITTQFAHGRRTGERIRVHSVVGTTEAIGEWIITVNSTTSFLLNGSVFVNAWVSGGIVFFIQPRVRVADATYQTGIPGGHAVIGNGLSSQLGCPVMLINRSVGGQAIEYFYSYTYAGIGTGGALTVLHAKHAGTIGSVTWLHGHNNIGQTSYFSDSGSVGSYVGWGALGILIDFWTAEFPNNDFKFCLCGFSSCGGIVSALQPISVHNFRLGYKDWVDRKRAAGESRVSFSGWYHDHQPMSENGVPLNSHRNPPDYQKIAARIAHAFAAVRGAVANDATGPVIASASRSGAVITLTVTPNGGSTLRVLRSGAMASGFEVSADNFATKLPISAITFPTATTIQLTLASDPGMSVQVRYQFGYVGDYPAGTYFTPRITNVSNNGSGVIRVTTSTNPTDVTPNGSQAVGGHGLSTGQWCRIKDVAGTTEANGIWQVTVIDTQNFDLDGSAFVNAYTGVLYGVGTPAVVKEIGVAVYDDRTIGNFDTDGAPLAPTYLPLVAA